MTNCKKFCVRCLFHGETDERCSKDGSKWFCENFLRYCAHLKLCRKSPGICCSNEVEFVGAGLIVLAESQHAKRDKKPAQVFGAKVDGEPFVGCAARLNGFLNKCNNPTNKQANMWNSTADVLLTPTSEYYTSAALSY